MQKNFSGILIVAAALLISACSVNVKKSANGGDDKNVDIKTPFTDIHVEKDADARDTGLQVYPGARLKPKKGNDDSSANVNLSAFGYALKVVVLKYESEDSPNKIQKFYQNELKHFGGVLECHTSHRGDYDTNVDHDSSAPVKCSGDNSGNIVELKSGTEGNQHVVSIEPRDKGTDFTLVYVRTHGKEDTI
jgi:hypothetical protein